MSQNYLQMPEGIQIDESSRSATFARFTVQPLERGYGVTIGNSLRRVLVSSLQGIAITGVKFEGVSHEFSTIPGVVEDVTDIVLNLKQIRFKSDHQKFNKIYIKVKGPTTLTAAEIQKVTDEVEVLNPSQEILTLNTEKTIEFEIRLSKGKGYVPSDDNKTPDQSIGLISVDALFSPVKTVTYTIENTRVGQRTDYEKLILDLHTDGSINPEDALAQASKILKDHLQFFHGFEKGAEENVKKEKVYDEEFLNIRRILKTAVDDLELSVRSHNCLKAANVKILADLVRKDESEMLKFRNFGRKSLAELTELVHVKGLSFGMDVDKYLEDDEDYKTGSK
ncbi:MAG: DNA-directed RNA polymerase subunit alpha [Bacteroidetes bacterium]|nr:DNA-directed RNA polymerase subunit alpha [Bacteroidota bacterium]